MGKMVEIEQEVYLENIFHDNIYIFFPKLKYNNLKKTEHTLSSIVYMCQKEALI